ncbi:MAG: nuclear transport factor 2 family protein [Micropepsaceae bacterium]
MSAQAHKDLISAIYGRMAAGEIDVLLENLTDDIEWTHQINPQLATFGGTHKGIPAVRANFQQINEGMPPQAIEGHQMIAEGDHVCVLCQITRTDPAGQPVSTKSLHHFTFRDGKIATFLEILDTAEVLTYIQDSKLAAGTI